MDSDYQQNKINLNIVLNKKPEIKAKIQIRRNDPYNQIQKQIIKCLHLCHQTVQQLRNFKKNGVEVFEEDFEYIKENEIIYVSQGEDFNQKSVLVEYETIKILGQGGFGSVYLAKHIQTNELFAIKLVFLLSLGNTKDVEMIFAEINALKNLQHKNIVKIQECYTFKDMKAYFIMEYLPGVINIYKKGNLQQYIQNIELNRLDEVEAQFFFKQILSAIYYCHFENIIHRDLKLENIMLTDLETKIVKVCDFGIAGICTQTNNDPTLAGSPKYISPEVLTKRAPANPSMDVWSLGIMLYKMLYGVFPFEGESRKEIFEKIKKGEFDFPQKPQVSISCLSLIQSMLQLEPENRVTTVEISNHPWINKEIKIILQEENDQQITFQDFIKDINKIRTQNEQIIMKKIKHKQNIQTFKKVVNILKKDFQINDLIKLKKESNCV